MFLNGDEIDGLDERGNRVTDDSFCLMFNAHYEKLDFTIPDATFGAGWEVVFDTADGVLERRQSHADAMKPGDKVTIEDRSIVVLRRTEV